MIHVRCARLASKKVNEHWQDTVLKNIELHTIKDLLTDAQLDNLYLEVQREKNEAKAEEIAVQLEKDIKNGLYGEEY